MIEVELPDGTVLEFPEGTDQATMKAAIDKLQGKAQDPNRAYMEARARGEMPAPVAMTDQRAAEQAAIDTAAAPPPRAHVSKTESLLAGALQGGTFGFADEIGAALAAPLSGQTYGQLRDQVRGQYKQAEADNPITYTGGEVGGAVLSSLLGGGALGLGAKGATLGTRAAQGAAIGAGEGALYGFGSGEGLEDRAKGALTYGSLGGVLGGAAPLVTTGVRRGFDAAVAGPIASMRSSPSQTRAGQAIVDALQRSGMTADDVARATRQAATEGQPEFMAVDAMGRTGQRLLSSMARTTPEATEEISQFLTSRQATQGERLSRIISEAMQAPDTAAARQAALKKARDEAANVAYEAARKGAGPVDVRGVLSAIDDRIGPMQGMGVAGDGIDATLSKFRNRLAAKNPPAGTTAVELSDFDRVLGVKRDVQDAIGAAVRAGRNNEARELTSLVRELDSALESASDGYRAANDDFAKASRVIDQIEAGKEAARPMVRSEDVLSRYGKMTPEEQASFRVGRAEPTLSQINAAAEGANKARPLTSGKAQTELGAMASDAEKLQRQIARENVMFETGRKTLGGSETAERLADDARISAETAGVIGNLLSGNFGAAAKNAGIQGINTLTGRNAETRKMIAQALMSGNLDEILRPAIQQAQRQGKQDVIVEALIRALPRLATGQ